MFFIFGFGKQTIKTRWPGQERTCPRCSNTKLWPYKKITYWFTLFFIPIIPYRVRYVTVCPICGHYEEIDKAQFENAESGSEEGMASHVMPSKPGLTEVQRRYNKEMANYEHMRKHDDKIDP